MQVRKDREKTSRYMVYSGEKQAVKRLGTPTTVIISVSFINLWRTLPKWFIGKIERRVEKVAEFIFSTEILSWT